MKLHQSEMVLLAAVVALIESSSVFAGTFAADNVTPLPAPSIVGLVVIGIATVVGITRRK